MKKIKRVLALACALTLALPSGSFAAAPKKTKKPTYAAVKKAYDNHYMKYYYNKPGFPDVEGWRYDYNRDGIQEMYILYSSGVRSACRLFTYYNGRVVKMHSRREFSGVNGVHRLRGTGFIVISSSESAFTSIDSVYRISKGRLVPVSRYVFSSDGNGNYTYTKNGRKISRKTWKSFQNRIY